MSALSARRRTTAPRSIAISSPTHKVVDWTTAITVVSAAGVPGVVALREQDDIILDPHGGYVFYFTGSRTTNWDATSYVWRTTSADGLTWVTPVECTAAGVALRGQDPSLVQTFGGGAPLLHRDDGGRMWMYLENNATNQVQVLSSVDGIAWDLVNAAVIPRGAGWDSALTGSPLARHDGSRYIVGYEGIQGSTESFGIAFGTSPGALMKHAANPVLTASSLGVPGTSAFPDAMWVSGGLVHLTGHSGYDSGTTMWRASTGKLDPSTWAAGDFTLIGMVDTVRNDLTAYVHQGRLVTQPASDLLIVTVGLTSS